MSALLVSSAIVVPSVAYFALVHIYRERKWRWADDASWIAVVVIMTPLWLPAAAFCGVMWCIVWAGTCLGRLINRVIP